MKARTAFVAALLAPFSLLNLGQEKQQTAPTEVNK
jgi:hypothetical protein